MATASLLASGLHSYPDPEYSPKSILSGSVKIQVETWPPLLKVLRGLPMPLRESPSPAVASQDPWPIASPPCSSPITFPSCSRPHTPSQVLQWAPGLSTVRSLRLGHPSSDVHEAPSLPSSFAQVSFPNTTFTTSVLETAAPLSHFSALFVSSMHAALCSHSRIFGFVWCQPPRGGWLQRAPSSVGLFPAVCPVPGMC